MYRDPNYHTKTDDDPAAVDVSNRLRPLSARLLKNKIGISALAGLLFVFLGMGYNGFGGLFFSDPANEVFLQDIEARDSIKKLTDAYDLTDDFSGIETAFEEFYNEQFLHEVTSQGGAEVHYEYTLSLLPRAYNTGGLWQACRTGWRWCCLTVM